MEFDEEEADRVEARLDLLRRLSRIYGQTTKEMIRYRDAIRMQLDELDDSDEAAERLERSFGRRLKR